ncbi:hypothetical protein ACU4GA_12125 [Methylobacterium oryzae CBMB20]
MVMLALGASVGLMIAFVITLHATVRRHVMAPLMRLLLAMREIEHKRLDDRGPRRQPTGRATRSTSSVRPSTAWSRACGAATPPASFLVELERAHDGLERANRQVIDEHRLRAAHPGFGAAGPERAGGRRGRGRGAAGEPLHVVGGDYFWLEEIDGLCVIAVADCTGHGVPGAFLTLIVATALDRLLHERGLRAPSAILAGARTAMVRTQLRQ